MQTVQSTRGAFVKLQAVFFVVLATCYAQLYNYHRQGLDWDTQGWSCLLPTSIRQSPVDIVTVPSVTTTTTTTTDVSSTAPPLVHGYQPEPQAPPPGRPELTIFSSGGYHRFKVEQNMHSIRVTVTGSADKLIVDETEYLLKFYDLRAPSEHTINGQRASLEVQLAFQNADNIYSFMSVMFNGTDDSTIPLYKVLALDGLAAIESLNSTTASATNTNDNKYDILDDTMLLLMANDARLYTYEGSMTFPPCIEGMKWFVWDKMIPTPTASVETVAGLMKYEFTKGNYRAQPIYYQSSVVVNSYPKGAYNYTTKSSACSVPLRLMRTALFLLGGILVLNC